MQNQEILQHAADQARGARVVDLRTKRPRGAAGGAKNAFLAPFF